MKLSKETKQGPTHLWMKDKENLRTYIGFITPIIFWAMPINLFSYTVGEDVGCQSRQSGC